MAEDRLDWFLKARFGLFIHYGLYSMIGRGEWALNRERIPLDEYRALADRFTAENFDADAICDLAVEAGMKYVNLTTMHHDGFRLYDTELSDFNSVNACGRDLVDEFVTAARKRDLKVVLYHTLNNWMAQPDAVEALEDESAYDEFIANTHERIRELVTRFNPIDLLWYDGSWPFNAERWQAKKMNEMVREIQPHIVLNGRNGLPGDFATPEGHMTAPTPWRPWEACMTFNEKWGFHVGDNNWKRPNEIINLLAKAAAGKGNLLFNIGPKGDGSVPQQSVDILKEVGRWMKLNSECLFDTDLFIYDMTVREPHHRSDWSTMGPFTAKGNTLYHLVRFWPGETYGFGGLRAKVNRITLLATGQEIAFEQTEDRLVLKNLPAEAPDPTCSVMKIECDRAPEVYITGGMRVPNAPHPVYDPVHSDILEM